VRLHAGIVPGIHPHGPTAHVGDSPGGGQKHPGHVRQLGEREVDEERAHQGDMGVKGRIKGLLGQGRMQRDQPHGQILDGNHVHLDHVAHPDAGQRDADEQEQGEVVLKQGNVADLGVEDAPRQQEEQTGQKQGVGLVQQRQADLHDGIEKFRLFHEHGHRLGEKAQVPDEDDEEGIMEQQREQPQPFRRAVGDLGTVLLQLDRGVAEQRPEGQHFEQHAHHDARSLVGIIPRAVFDPGQGFLLPAGGGNAKRHRPAGPAEHLERQPHHENEDRDVREGYPEQRTHPSPGAQPRDDDERQYREKGIKHCHGPSPR